ncbi:MAG TPA: hypothetical protein VER96_32860 [Polyangiaceae bacterium]|nr:hypothetical protein [Polyangiaceae bacterium]
MSGHSHHDAGADPHAGHDEHHDETTSDDFPADEPHSPAWLPLLGGGLLLAGIFALVLLGSDDKSVAASTAEAAPAKVAPVAVNSAQRPLPSPRPNIALPPGHVPVPAPHP